MTDAVQADTRPTLHLPQTYTAEAAETLKLAWPLVLTQLASMAIGVTDVLMLGWIGPEALAGAALGLSLYYLPLMFGFGLISALSPLLAQAIGADPHGLDINRRSEATETALRRHFRTGLWAVIFVGIPAIAMLLFAPFIFRLLNQHPDLSLTASHFIYAMLPGLLFNLIIGVMRNLFSALSRPRPAMTITLFWIGLNALLNWVLIFGHFGLPALGVVGSGIGSSIATIIAAGVMMVAVAKHPATAPLKVGHNIFRIDWEGVWAFIKLGTPIGLTLLFEGGAFNAGFWIVGQFETGQIAGHQIAMNVASVTFQMALGVAFAATVRVGYAAGANDWHAVRRAGHVGMGLALVFMSVAAAIMWLLPYAIADLYLDLNDPKALDAARYAAQFLAIAALFQLFDGLQVASAFALRGLKDTRLPMLIAGFSYWVVGIPCCLALAFWGGLEGAGVWMGFVVSLIVAAVLLTWRFEALTRARKMGHDDD